MELNRQLLPPSQENPPIYNLFHPKVDSYNTPPPHRVTLPWRKNISTESYRSLRSGRESPRIRGERTSRLNLTEASDWVARVHESVAALPQQLNRMTSILEFDL
jgi:hypothetical protein